MKLLRIFRWNFRLDLTMFTMASRSLANLKMLWLKIVTDADGQEIWTIWATLEKTEMGVDGGWLRWAGLWVASWRRSVGGFAAMVGGWLCWDGRWVALSRWSVGGFVENIVVGFVEMVSWWLHGNDRWVASWRWSVGGRLLRLSHPFPFQPPSVGKNHLAKHSSDFEI